MADSLWGDAGKQAMKILGDKGQLPDLKAIAKFDHDVVGKAIEAFHKSRDDVETKMTDLQGQYEKLSSMIDQFEAKVEKSDLGLNEKDKEESKKIKEAGGILSDHLLDMEKTVDTYIKDLKDALRNIIQLSKYKPDSISG